MGKNSEKYKYLRLPAATPAEAAARREHLIKIGTIRPASEAYACEHGVPVIGYGCPTCGAATLVWK